MPPNTLVDGYTFLVTPDNPLPGFGPGDLGGLYHRDTRYLSRLELDVAGRELTRIGATLESPAARTETFAPTAPVINEMSERNVPKHTDLVITRRRRVREGVGLRDRLEVANHATEPREIDLTIGFGTDFADIFEVRGLASGIDRTIESTVGERSVTARYGFEGPEGPRTVATTIGVDPAPTTLTTDRAAFAPAVPAGDTAVLTIAAGLGEEPVARSDIGRRAPPVALPEVPASGMAYGRVFERATADLTALTTRTDHGPVPLAGTPWFVAPFGRDALVAAYQALPVAPALATGTLRYLAAHRGRETDPDPEEEPGKIFHEQRHGELAIRGLVPHSPYYGTIDATPLWVVLLAEVCDWQGSPALAAELRPALVKALEWIVRTSTAGPDDPFLYYDSSTRGLTHKAWKDTADSIRFADGEPADRPLAVAEVQGYAVAALRRGAALLEATDGPDATAAGAPPDDYRALAADIERAFDAEFWLPSQGYYGLAKTAEGRIVDAIASNVGHCLWTGLVSDERAAAVVDTLTGDALAGGWGLRTMSSGDAGYSPVSYHAGGVWPHDTSLTAIGLARYGYGDAAERLGRYVLEAAETFPNHRLPELYCGFERDRQPAIYPAACTPQAWGAGAPFAVLRAAFALEPGPDGQVRVGRTPDLFGRDALEPIRDTWGEPHVEPVASTGEGQDG